MISRMPATVQTAWGEAVAHDFEIWLEDVMDENAVGKKDWQETKTELGSMGTRLTAVETRLTNVEQNVADLRTELRELRRSMEERFDRMNTYINERFDRQSAEVNARFDALQRLIVVQTRWNIGLIALFCTILAVLYGLDRFAP